MRVDFSNQQSKSDEVQQYLRLARIARGVMGAVIIGGIGFMVAASLPPLDAERSLQDASVSEMQLYAVPPLEGVRADRAAPSPTRRACVGRELRGLGWGGPPWISSVCASHRGAAYSQQYSQAQVVADDACPKYAVDIASYATCDRRQARVTAAVRSPSSLIPELRVPQHKQLAGLYVDAGDAYRLKTRIRGAWFWSMCAASSKIVIAGRTRTADIHVPYLEPHSVIA